MLTRLALIAVLLAWCVPVAAQSLHLDRLSVLASVAGQAADGVTTYRFLHNGSGCLETNPMLGTRPSVTRITAHVASNVTVVTLAQYVPLRLGHRSISRLEGYASAVSGGAQAIASVRTCGG